MAVQLRYWFLQSQIDILATSYILFASRNLISFRVRRVLGRDGEIKGREVRLRSVVFFQWVKRLFCEVRRNAGRRENADFLGFSVG